MNDVTISDLTMAEARSRLLRGYETLGECAQGKGSALPHRREASVPNLEFVSEPKSVGLLSEEDASRNGWFQAEPKSPLCLM